MRNFIMLLFLFFRSIYAFSQADLRESSLTSNVLNKEIKYSVSLPPDYNQGTEYPVIFYLHAFAADHHSGAGFTKQVNALIDQKAFPDAVVIAADAGKSWYIDDYANKNQYATMFLKEFLPAIEKQYSISKNPSKRAIIGVSMGGFGALRFAMLHPDKFGVCVSLMGGIMTREQARDDQYYDIYHKDLYGANLKGEDRMNAYFVDNNPLYLIYKAELNKISKVSWFVQCCDQDFHAMPNRLLHQAMLERGIGHTYKDGPGDHNSDCYGPVMSDAIDFIKQAFLKRKDRVKFKERKPIRI